MLGICVGYNVLFDVSFFNVLVGIDFCSSWVIRMMVGGLVGFVISGLVAGLLLAELVLDWLIVYLIYCVAV